MKIKKSDVSGNFLIDISVFRDGRGAFEVFWEDQLLRKSGVLFRPESAYHSYNQKRDTVRAFHYQTMPHGQAKLVSCVAGRVWDVAVDLREGSPTFLRWAAVELEAGSGRSHLIPAGCAHGFVTLEDNTTIAYLVEGAYQPSAARVIRWNDPTLNVPWPICDPILSDKDRSAPLWNIL
jgi:dTDP-4-dehydrorhamnose 3,5-epimerase